MIEQISTQLRELLSAAKQAETNATHAYNFIFGYIGTVYKLQPGDAIGADGTITRVSHGDATKPRSDPTADAGEPRPGDDPGK